MNQLKEEDIILDEKEYKKRIDADIQKINKKRKVYSRRILREIKSNKESKQYEFRVIDDTHWLFIFTVPHGIYKGQTHQIKMKLIYGQHPHKKIYPCDAPLCSFTTPIWHPNISLGGTICLDTLTEQWSPCMNTSSVIQTIKLLLECPDPSSPMNREAAEQYKNSREEYYIKVKEYYVKGPN